MANWTQLKAAIANVIKTNGNQEITGAVLQNTLNSIVNAIGENATFAGIATPSTNPGTPDGPVFYIATKAGVYSNFGGLEVLDGDAVIFEWYNGSWSKKVIGFATQEKLTQLEQKQILGDIYDVSAHNDNAVFESLQVLLNSSSLNTLIPISVRHGGMSIRFIQGSVPSSDNKYVQYRLMSQNFTTDTTQWQGVDDEPIAESNNLVKSRGVFNCLNKVPTLFGDISNADLNIGDDKCNVILELKGGHIKTKNFDSRTGNSSFDYVIVKGDESDANLNIGDGKGNVLIEFKEGHLRTKHFDSRDLLGTPITFNTEQCLCSISPSNLGHYLSKVAFAGDSLIANQLGGEIPVSLDEGDGKRPMRLLSNTVARRFYDKYCWNKPQWRRLDSTYNAESNPNGWIISGFDTFTENDLFAGTQEVYYTSSVADSYARITIPDGFENFAIIVRTKSGNGILGVTINGSAPSSITYQNPVITYNTEMTASSLRTKLTNNTIINSSVVPLDLPCGPDQIDTNIGITGHGNPYAIYQWNNLPSGDNTIELKNISGRTDIWGGFYWSGNTMVVINCAHGGHTINSLNHHYPDELYSVDYDSIIFEIPEMNNLRETLDVTISGIKNIFNNLSGKDVLYTSCNSLGKSIVNDTNYYTYYTNPTQKELNTVVRELMFKYDKPFLDLFTYYAIMTKLRGGNVEDGDAGLYFTWDGQHGNEVGIGIWFESIASIVRTKPLSMFI